MFGPHLVQVLLAQLRRQAHAQEQERARKRDVRDGDDTGSLLATDVYTYNAMILAATTARKPTRALRYGREMTAAAIAPDAATLALLADAYVAKGAPLEAIKLARRLISSGALPELNLPSAARLLTACAKASRRSEDAPAARDALLWVLRTLAGTADAAAAMGAPHVDGDAPPLMDSVITDAHAAWYARPTCVRDVLRTLGNAEDFGAARSVFETTPKPRPRVVWSTMLDVCNACGEPAFASAVLAESMPGLGAFLAPGELEELGGGLSAFVASRSAPLADSGDDEENEENDEDEDEDEDEEYVWDMPGLGAFLGAAELDGLGDGLSSFVATASPLAELDAAGSDDEEVDDR